MNEHTCIGCGALLQTTTPLDRGYTTKIENDYCQSCFRLRHYRDFKRVKQVINDSTTLEFIEQFDGHILWVVDVLHLNQSLHSGLLRSLRKKEVVLVVNKRDVLPKAVSDEKLKQRIMKILRNDPIQLMDVVFVSAMKPHTLEQLLPYIEDAPCALVGCVNAGKSSILNGLTKKDTLSVSPVASTTADVVKIHFGDHEIVDTPGISNETSIVDRMSDEALLSLAPKKEMKPKTFQIYEPQTLLFGNIGAITFYPKNKISVTAYFPVDVKRIKPDRLEANLALDHELSISEPHYVKRSLRIANPTQFDIECFDLGFFNVQGDCTKVEAFVDKDVMIEEREALI